MNEQRRPSANDPQRPSENRATHHAAADEIASCGASEGALAGGCDAAEKAGPLSERGAKDRRSSETPRLTPTIDGNALTNAWEAHALPTEPSTDDMVAELIEQIKQSAEQLRHDHTSRGDLKILSRTLRELRYAFKVFAPFRHVRKVTVFGSARTPPDAPAYLQTIEFGRRMAAEQWLIITGAAQGIMEAGHVGAGRAHSMGLNIMLPFEQSANSVIAGDPKLVHMKYFFNRKLMFVKESDAICLLPGGFGTLDEGLEVLTLLQTGKRDMIPVVMLDAPGGTYWHGFQAFVREHLLGGAMIDADDLALYKITDNCEEAVNEILGFFRVYHSMRYVRQRLVIRLNREIGAAAVERLNEEFAEILVEGRIETSEALPEERDDLRLAKLPRLVMHFNRRHFGRLRQMIDAINGAE